MDTLKQSNNPLNYMYIHVHALNLLLGTWENQSSSCFALLLYHRSSFPSKFPPNHTGEGMPPVNVLLPAVDCAIVPYVYNTKVTMNLI